MTEYGQENLEYKSMLNKQLWESLNLTSPLNKQHVSVDQVRVDGGGGAHGGVGQEECLVGGGQSGVASGEGNGDEVVAVQVHVVAGGTRLFNIRMRGYTYVEMAVLLVMMEVERVGVLMHRDQDCHTTRVVIKRPSFKPNVGQRKKLVLLI